MAAVSSIIGAVGLGISAVGTVAGIQAQQERNDALKDAEKARKKQANLSARRKTRQRVRQAIVAQSEALTNTTARGANFSSALPGSQAQVSGEVGTAVSGIQQSRELGNRVFDANARAADARSSMATASGLTSLGGTIFNARGAISSFGDTLFA